VVILESMEVTIHLSDDLPNILITSGADGSLANFVAILFWNVDAILRSRFVASKRSINRMTLSNLYDNPIYVTCDQVSLDVGRDR